MIRRWCRAGESVGRGGRTGLHAAGEGEDRDEHSGQATHGPAPARADRRRERQPGEIRRRGPSKMAAGELSARPRRPIAAGNRNLEHEAVDRGDAEVDAAVR